MYASYASKLFLLTRMRFELSDSNILRTIFVLKQQHISMVFIDQGKQ